MLVHAIATPNLAGAARRRVRDITPPGGDALAVAAGTVVDGEGANTQVYVVLRAPQGVRLSELMGGGSVGSDARSRALDLFEAMLAMLAAVHGEGGNGGVSCGTLAPERIVRLEDGTTRLVEPVHANAFLAQHGVPTRVDAVAAPWQAAERAGGGAPSVSGDLYAAAVMALAYATGSAAPRVEQRDEDVTEMLWESDFAPAVRALFQSCVSAEPQRRPVGARDLLAAVRAARGVQGDLPVRRLDFLDAEEATEVVDRDLAIALQRGSTSLPWYARPTFWLALTVVLGGATFFTVRHFNPKPELVSVAPAPDAAWAALKPSLASLGADEALRQLHAIRGDARAPVALQNEIREAEAPFLLVKGDQIDAASVLYEACQDAEAPRLTSCKAFGDAVIDGALGVYPLQGALASLDRACAGLDSAPGLPDACTRRDRVERALPADAMARRQIALVSACGGGVPDACARAGVLAEVRGEYLDAAAYHGEACARGDADGCAGEAVTDAMAGGALREGSAAKAEKACSDGSARGCFVRGQLEDGAIAVRKAAKAAGGKPVKGGAAKLAKSPRRGKGSKNGKRGATGGAAAPVATPPAKDASSSWYTRACEGGWGEACELMSDRLAATAVVGDVRPRELLERACALDVASACGRLSERPEVSATVRVRAAVLGWQPAFATVLGDRALPYAGVAQRMCEVAPEGEAGLAACTAAAQGATVLGDLPRALALTARACVAGDVPSCERVVGVVSPVDTLSPEALSVLGKRCTEGDAASCGVVSMLVPAGKKARQGLEQACTSVGGLWCLRAAARRALDGEPTLDDRTMLERNATQDNPDGYAAAHALAATLPESEADRAMTLRRHACGSGYALACEDALGKPALGLVRPSVDGAGAVCTKEDSSGCLTAAAAGVLGTDEKAARKGRTTLETGCRGGIASRDRAACGVLGWAQATGTAGKADRAKARDVLERTCLGGIGKAPSCRNLGILLAGLDGVGPAPTAAALTRARTVLVTDARALLALGVRSPALAGNDYGARVVEACKGAGDEDAWLCANASTLVAAKP